ncbi:MAG TPA: hypothetical protein VMR62_37965 [Bryobacteraceae bacterium]|jgi:hypothetical protein|nr:hypothetical protein [Bryobacteraceae bacterium]
MGSISSINNLSSSYLQSLLSTGLQKTGTAGSSSGTASVTSQPESGQLSPFAQVMSTLQQLQESNPAEYGQVTGQIATNLQSAAKTAQADGNSTQATQLNQLASNFTSASQSGQSPNIQDLAQTLGGGGHHHHHFHSSVHSDSDSSTSSDSTTSGSSTNQMNQMLAAFQTNSSANESLDPMAIISNTLSSAGINVSSQG